jgi:hypothetical protein
MKYFIIGIALLIVLASCKNNKKPIVSTAFVDSLINNYTAPAIQANEIELQFWKNRINPNGGDIVNGSKYAASLINRFHLLGNITDVKKSDSVLKQLAADFNGKEAGPYFAMVSHCILQHQFKEAEMYLDKARAIGLKQYENAAVSFDVNFELGKISFAATNLKTIQFNNDYGYQFRKSKMMHYKGELDSSLTAMQAAVNLSGSNADLKLAALSNSGDLYIHAGKLYKAFDCFTQCVKQNAADLHSIMGIGWLALVHDHNDSLAEKIFQFAHTQTQSPEPVFKLIQVAAQRGDTALEKKYALEFETLVTNTRYGRMYNKYLIQLYTSILNNPAKATAIAKDELNNRTTPQIYAWNVWALLADNKKEEAYDLYNKKVSGKPLEGLELYWMGKLMQALNKGYNATQYFEEAAKNQYDLPPAVVKDIEKNL